MSNEMSVEKVRKDDTARTYEFLFMFYRVWINSRLLLVLFTSQIFDQEIRKCNNDIGRISRKYVHICFES